eukprot:3549339-Pleurochrysis_carterae.AAC.1
MEAYEEEATSVSGHRLHSVRTLQLNVDSESTTIEARSCKLSLNEAMKACLRHYRLQMNCISAWRRSCTCSGALQWHTLTQACLKGFLNVSRACMGYGGPSSSATLNEHQLEERVATRY